MTSRQAQVASLSAHLQVRPRNARAFSSCSATRGVMDRNALRLRLYIRGAVQRRGTLHFRKFQNSPIRRNAPLNRFFLKHTRQAKLTLLASRLGERGDVRDRSACLFQGSPRAAPRRDARLALRRRWADGPLRRLAPARQPGRPRPSAGPAAGACFRLLVFPRATFGDVCLAFPDATAFTSSKRAAERPGRRSRRAFDGGKGGAWRRARSRSPRDGARQRARVACSRRTSLSSAPGVELERREPRARRARRAPTFYARPRRPMRLARRSDVLAMSRNRRRRTESACDRVRRRKTARRRGRPSKRKAQGEKSENGRGRRACAFLPSAYTEGGSDELVRVVWRHERTRRTPKRFRSFSARPRKLLRSSSTRARKFVGNGRRMRTGTQRRTSTRLKTLPTR